MDILWIVLAAIAYCAIGGLLGGIITNALYEPLDGFWIFCMFVWPISLVVGLTLMLFIYPFKLGERLYEMIRDRKLGGKHDH